MSDARSFVGVNARKGGFSMTGPIAPTVMVPAIVLSWLACVSRAASEDASLAAAPRQIVIVNPNDVNPKTVSHWKIEGFKAVVLNLNELFDATTYADASKTAAANGVDVYYWIEVGRNVKFATEHPDWMASLGMHDDWQRQFPKVRQLGKDEVVKAWPWTPIAYRDAFDAHIARIKRLLARVPSTHRGLLLNDLQGGPSSCGCGNLQCRWAIDYHVPATAKKLDGHDIAAKFIKKVAALAPDKQIIPVWTTECELHDLALEKQHPPTWTTGHCGDVDCMDNCFARFVEQWNGLQQTQRGPVALLALHKEFRRDRSEYGPTPGWINHAVKYINRKELKPPADGELWVVVEGFGVEAADEMAARRAANQAGADTVLVARIHIDQSYDPCLISLPKNDSDER
jgi:hypothetical protein